MTTLYTLTGEYLALQSALVEAEGELTPEIAEMFDTLPGDYTTKLENCAKAVRMLKAQAEVFGAERGRMADRQRALENRAAWLQEKMHDSMRATNTPVVKGALLSVRVQANPPSIGTVDLSQVPAAYIKTERSLMAREVLDAFKANGAVPAGVEIVTGRSHLVIR